jgi:hypothetical protein
MISPWRGRWKSIGFGSVIGLRSGAGSPSAARYGGDAEGILLTFSRPEGRDYRGRRVMLDDTVRHRVEETRMPVGDFRGQRTCANPLSAPLKPSCFSSCR